MNKFDIATGYRYHYLARLVIEAQTPLVIGNGKKGVLTDSVINRDVNKLPYIPGTALAGSLRHALTDAADGALFGTDKDQGRGSQLIFSDAMMIGASGEVHDGMCLIEWRDPFYEKFEYLPVRQHVRIGSKGAAEDAGKFDEQVVYKGVRFCFEVEMLSEEDREKQFCSILNTLSHHSFRIGAGSRKGFGVVSIIPEISKWAVVDYCDKLQLEDYLKKSSLLSDDSFWQNKKPFPLTAKQDERGIRYELTLTPEDFFLFGSGQSDDEVDITPVTEAYIVWNGSGIPEFVSEREVQKNILIPASSVKGALAHRTAFYWNKGHKRFAGNEGENRPLTGDENPAISALFGTAGNNGVKLRGNVLFSDLLRLGRDAMEKVLNHVAIDRFTGGAIEGALFAEKVMYAQAPFVLHFTVDKAGIEANLIKSEITSGKDASAMADEVIEYFETSLKDLATGMLPLGGGVNRGHGTFYGECTKNGVLIF